MGLLLYLSQSSAAADLSLSATEGADLASAGLGLVVVSALAGVEGADTCSAGVEVVETVITCGLNATEGADSCSAGATHAGGSASGGWHYGFTRKPKRKTEDEDPAEVFPVVEVQAPDAIPANWLNIVPATPLNDAHPGGPLLASVAVSAEDEQRKRNEHALRLLLLAS